MLTLPLRSLLIVLMSTGLAACGSSSGGNSGSINVSPPSGEVSPPNDEAPPSSNKRPTIGYTDNEKPLIFSKSTTSLKETTGFLNDLLLLAYPEQGSKLSASIEPFRVIDAGTPLDSQVRRNAYEDIGYLTVQGPKEIDRISGTVAIYKQEYSSIVMSRVEKVEGIFTSDIGAKTMHLTQVLGEPLQYLPGELAGQKSVEYTGPAFSYNQEGDFKYKVDFAAMTGNGKISFSKGTEYILQEVKLNKPGELVRLGTHQGYGASKGEVSKVIDGKTTDLNPDHFSYEFLFYGKDAAEIVGRVVNGDSDIVFTGSR